MVEEKKDFETYLISTLNDSLIKKSIPTIDLEYSLISRFQMR